ncbi:MAG: THUMP domain-containing protein [Leptolyngbyaceae cyanobacterium MO_188.B28]|nr:THUMP domain-containing protein [Leptolyngbyaceae cyanobacterium MO_188.B28]
MAFRYQYFATVARGLEAIAARELEALGAQFVQPKAAGVYFEGNRALLYRANLWTRIPFRILLKIAEFPCHDAKELYRRIQRLDWSQYLKPHNTLAVDATGGNRALNHTHFTALQVKNAIVDQQRRQFGRRSSVDIHHPDVRINLHIESDHATLSLDSSGESLHRRGYRPAVGRAPLKETLAAALIEMTEWDSHSPLLDPLCGSGSLLLEACLKALNIAPGLFRSRFGFESWPDFDANLWRSLREEARASRKQIEIGPIMGSDRDPDVIHHARTNAQQCGVAGQVQFRQQDIAELEAPCDTGVIICNPPYGERLGKGENLGDFYRLLGRVLKNRFKGWTAFVLSGNKELSQNIGLKSAHRVTVYNGGLKCQLLKYELY